MKIEGKIYVDAYSVLCRAVEEGIGIGWRRAHKHTSSPGEHDIRDHMEREVMSAIAEFFTFTEEGEEE